MNLQEIQKQFKKGVTFKLLAGDYRTHTIDSDDFTIEISDTLFSRGDIVLIYNEEYRRGKNPFLNCFYYTLCRKGGDLVKIIDTNN